MSELAVVDASPLILLSRINQLGLLMCLSKSIEELVSAGMYLSEQTIIGALQRVGE